MRARRSAGGRRRSAGGMRQEAVGGRQGDYNLIFNLDLILEIAVKAGYQSMILQCPLIIYLGFLSESKEFAVRHVF
jgi:hypothetical protein